MTADPLTEPSRSEGRPHGTRTGPYLKGRQRQQLVIDLAEGDETHEALGVKYDRTREAISQFAGRNRQEIEDTRARLEDRYLRVYSADKLNRLVDQDEEIELLQHDLHNPRLSWEERQKIAATLQKLRRYIAEEMGDLRQNIEVHAPQLGHEIVGWTPGSVAEDEQGLR